MTKQLLLTDTFLFFSGTDVRFEQLTITCITIMLIVALICFLIGEITGNYSQVDKLWSIMPVVYSVIMLLSYTSTRLYIMSCLVTIWGLRLSFNFYRKGGYNIVPWKGEEDYRWKILRRHPKLKGRIRFGLFNLLFISFYQNFLILLFSSPLLLAAEYHNSRLSFIDIIAALFMLLFIVLEAIADNQLHRFQKLKRKSETYDNLSTDPARGGFLKEGLWHYVRHPNYASEQAIWISFYFFGVAASGNWFNWTFTGPILLVLLFLGSTEFTERISINKYHDYIAYKKNVPKYLPGFFKSDKK
jgi:steroid 5-alpha reductase family enzyme